MMDHLHLGFLVNPIAGMGGRVGLKGTDNMYHRALQMGAQSIAPLRAVEFLRELKATASHLKIEITTCPGIMGAEEVRGVGLRGVILPMELGDETDAEDTKKGIELMMERSMGLIVFVGGDGTARDILDAFGDKGDLPVLGVPSGVKMYSGVFAATPREAARLVVAFAEGEAGVREVEVIDADEEEIRRDRFSIRLYGYLKIPYIPQLYTGSKEISLETLEETENQEAIARDIVENMIPGDTYILGPGTTIKRVAELLGVGKDKTLLGVDIYQDGVLIRDVNEKKILEAVKDFDHTWIVISPIGRQGLIFGRGNQQISPEIVRRVGKDRIIVAATRKKLEGLTGRSLKIDTGDLEVDELFKGYIKVIIDYGVRRFMPLR